MNARVHRVTRRAPVEMLAEERSRLHRLPDHAWTTAFGQTRTVGCPEPMVVVDHCLYSVPHGLAGEVVWARYRGEEVIITHVGADGPSEVARHQRTTPGSPRIDASHFPPAPEGPLHRTPVPANAAEAEFLAIGAGAALWLKEAGAAGTTRVRAKMAEAVALAKLAGVEATNWALGHGAIYGRFAEGDLASIMVHRSQRCSRRRRPGQ